jgi:molybdenum cofactor cytidylyltransferase
MGQPKLLLPVQGQPLIAHVIAAWKQAGLTPLVVVRPEDAALAKLCQECGADVLQPAVAPAEMKISVQLALRHLAQRVAPTDCDAWLLAPADMPGLSPAIIARLVAIHRRHASAPPDRAILVPTLQEKRGHPVLFPCSLAEQVHTLRADEGVKALLARHPVQEVPCDDCVSLESQAFADVDTPADYDRLK